MEMVNPGGTGIPILVISCRPAPFPPRSSLMVARPSEFPLPKEKTLFFALAILLLSVGRFNATSDFLYEPINRDPYLRHKVAVS